MLKDFEEEFHRIYNLYKEKDSFLFLKAADGELMAINNVLLDNNEFQNNINVPQERRDELLKSLQFKHPNYYLGVICPCCCNYDGRNTQMIELSGQDLDHLTYANIFVNSNYKLYKEIFIPSFSEFDVHLVCHENPKIENLPFKPEKVWKIQRNAWVNNYDLIKEIQDLDLKNKLFLFAAGPFGNILGYNLFQSCPRNRMVDIGSTLNSFLNSGGFARDYHLDQNSGFGARKCVWN